MTPARRSRVDRRPLPQLLKEKTSEKVYPKTLIITALTAATVGLISTRLNGIVDSLLLVTLASILTAFISEFYRLTLEGTQKAISKAVTRSVDERIDELTGESAVVEEVIVVRGEGPSAQRNVAWLFFHRMFVSRWAVPMVFALVAAGTLSSSYFIGRIDESPIYRITNEITKTRDISNKKAEELEQLAKAEAAKQASQASATAEANADANANELVNATRAELIERIEALETDLAAAQEQRAADEAIITDLQEQIELLSGLLTDLQTQLDEMQTQLDETAVVPPEVTDPPAP